MNQKQPLKPARYAEDYLITGILKGEYPPGTLLPGERELATIVGVTRPTLRETLQRLAGEGWVTIRHGKPTLVNDYWSEGGMGLLSTLSKYGEYLPDDIVYRFLEFRAVMIPPISRMVCEQASEEMVAWLERAADLPPSSEAFTEFDWELQVSMASHSGNPLFRMILNDFEVMYRAMGHRYFSIEKCRELSRHYYDELLSAVRSGDASRVEVVVKFAMDQSAGVWREFVEKDH